MKLTRQNLTSIAVHAVTILVAGMIWTIEAETMMPSQDSSTDMDDAPAIALAMSAGPADVAGSARIVKTDTQGNTVVLREGSNGFTCTPGNPKVIGAPPMCSDATARQWHADFIAHKPKPTTTVPGIVYMLAGATQRSDSDPYDKTSDPITVGPHWMIMWPFDAKTTGLPTTHKSTAAYIMWAGSPYAHLHVMGLP